MNLIKISKMSGKLKGIPAINTNTLSNEFCKKASKNKDSICGICYSVNMLKTFRKNCVDPFEHNSKMLSSDVIPIQYLPKFNSIAVRFNAHGELINQTHLINLFNICKANLRVTFTLWTKRTDILKKVLRTHKKPKNIILIFSNSKLDAPIKPSKIYDKTFNYVTSQTSEINCFKDCFNCMKCYDQSDPDEIITEHIK